MMINLPAVLGNLVTGHHYKDHYLTLGERLRSVTEDLIEEEKEEWNGQVIVITSGKEGRKDHHMPNLGTALALLGIK